MRIADALLDADGRISEVLWVTARTGDQPVGRCHCTAAVFAGPTDAAWGRRFFTAVCLSGHEAVIPAARVVRAPTATVLIGVGGVSDELLAAGRARDAAILGEHGD